MDFSTLAGIMAGVLPTLSYVPFLRAIIRGDVQPHRISWLIWSIVYTVIVFQQFSAGGGPAMYLSIASTLISYVVFYLSIRRGIGVLNLVNALILLGVFTLIVLATTIAPPFTAILMMISITGTATLFTMYKTYKLPWSESLTFWSAHIVGAILSFAAALSEPSAALLAFPIYALIVTIAMTGMMLHRRNKLKNLTPA